MLKKHKTDRKGMTVIEIIVALILMAFAIIVMGRLTATRLFEHESLEYQYTMQAADGMYYNIYKDFHECRDLSIEVTSHTVDNITKDLNGDGRLNEADHQTVVSNVTTLSFDLGASGSHVYSYDSYLETFYYNGASQFMCDEFTVNGDTQHLSVSLRFGNGERLEYLIYK